MGDSVDRIVQLKAEAYDLLAGIEQLQAALRAKNQEIVALMQPAEQSNGQVKESLEIG